MHLQLRLFRRGHRLLWPRCACAGIANVDAWGCDFSASNCANAKSTHSFDANSSLSRTHRPRDTKGAVFGSLITILCDGNAENDGERADACQARRTRSEDREGSAAEMRKRGLLSGSSKSPRPLPSYGNCNRTAEVSGSKSPQLHQARVAHNVAPTLGVKRHLPDLKCGLRVKPGCGADTCRSHSPMDAHSPVAAGARPVAD